MMKLTALEIIGISALLASTYLFLREVWSFLYTSFIGHALGKTIQLLQLGKWAVITGATDGIGKAYAEELASYGLNIVLISRSLNKLENVARDIEAKFRVKTKIIDVDFTDGEEIYKKITKEMEGLEIGILINNVGMSYTYPEYLTEVPDVITFSQSLINCNILSVTRMTILVLPQMVSRKKGLILNISSGSAVLPTPLMTMYSSTKAFVLKFSEDLALEYAPYGITVQCVLPGFVVTNMSRIKRPTLKTPLPRDFVQGQLKTIGLEVSSAGYWIHKLQLLYYLALNKVYPSAVVKVTWNHLNRLRSRALQRMKHQNGETLKNK